MLPLATLLDLLTQQFLFENIVSGVQLTIILHFLSNTLRSLSILYQTYASATN
jgi:hypothetical protein